MKRILTIIAGSLLMLLFWSPYAQAAAPNPEVNDRANSWRYSDGAYNPASIAVRSEPSHPDATLLGIDVSHHQDVIDWEAVAQSDVDFVIIRCGYGMDQTDQDDRQFLNNVSECERLGIPYGIYLYSYATNTERAQSEAEHVLRLINGRKLSYPVYFDMEDHTTIDSDLAAIATTFCNQITAAGYPVGVYSSVYWWNTYLTDSCFSQWYRWVAHYHSSCEYEGDYQIWQFSSKGSIEGISANVDLNYQIGYPEDHGTDVFYHEYIATVTEPTCTEGGYTVFTCTICGNCYTACRKEPVEHPWDEGNIIIPATCTEVGSTLYTCTLCQETRQAVLPTEKHKFENSACTVCGAAAPSRLAGRNRYDTAFLAANALKQTLHVEKFETIIVASGNEFPDALSGSYLAAQKNAPILLVNQNTIQDVTDYIAANLTSGGTVYLLGGTAAIPAEMENALTGLDVRRLAGSNRYKTNLLILNEANTADQEILICTGKDFADSLSASAVNKPILLVNKTLDSDQKAFLEESAGKFIIIGGENAVSADLEHALKHYGSVERIGGANRYETSVAVARRFFNAPTHAVLAYAKNFPDGLCGGPLAYSMKAPLILTATNVEAAASNYAKENRIQSGIILGGPSLIDDLTVSEIFQMDAGGNAASDDAAGES